MFKVTIIRLRDVVKITFIIIVICILARIVFKAVNTSEKKISFNVSSFIEFGINNESSIIKAFSRTNMPIEEKTEEVEENGFNARMRTILKTGSNIFNIKEAEKKEKVENMEKVEEIEETEITSVEEKNKESTEPIPTTAVSTEIVTPDPIQESFNREYNGVKIKNETSYELTDDILNSSDLNINSDNVIIFHTHTCESYTPTAEYTYEGTGNFRTTDLNYSVARVGDELTNCLGSLGFKVNHNTAYHDYPSYTGSYNRSLATVESILPSFKSDIIIDLHRDAIGSKSSYAPTVKIGEEYCAQLMFVMGTDGGGLSHSNWNSNLKFAMKIQETANSIYPGLFKPLVLRNSRYNQHLGKAACIIEVGATGNTLNEALNSMKYLAKIMSIALK